MAPAYSLSVIDMRSECMWDGMQGPFKGWVESQLSSVDFNFPPAQDLDLLKDCRYSSGAALRPSFTVRAVP